MADQGPVAVLAVVRSPALGSALTSAVAPANGTTLEVCVGELKTIGAERLFEKKPDVLIVDIDTDDPEDMAVLNAMVATPIGAKIPVVATAATMSTSSLRRLLRDGVHDFLPQPLSAADVRDAVERAVASVQSQRGHGRASPVLSFIRAAGGMGATTLAVHTAFALLHDEVGARRDVCLIDLDLQFGNAALYLDLENGRGLVDIIRTPGRLDGALLRGAMAQHKNGLSILTAPNIPVPLDALQPDVTTRILDVARQEFDVVVVDLPHALSTWTESVLAMSTNVFLVTQLTVPALRQARRLLDLLQEEGHYALPLSVILNRYVHTWGDSIDVKQAEKALGRKVDFTIANDFELVMSALNQGVPAEQIRKRSKFCKQMRSMADAIARQAQVRLSQEAPAIRL